MAEQPQVVDMIDAIGANAGAIPAGTKRVAIYLTGSGGVAWTNADVAKLTKDDPQLQSVIRIDQANQSTNVFPQVAFIVVDIEPGAANIPEAVRIASARKQIGLRTGLYFFRAEENALRQAVTAAGLDDHVDYWAAYWDLDRDRAIMMLGHRGVKAVQWASPTSNPDTLVPGTSRTLRELNVDLSVTLADWPQPLPARPAKKTHVPPVVKKVVHKVKRPHPKVVSGSLAGGVAAAVITYLRQHGVHLTSAETGGLDLAVVYLIGYFTPSKKSAA